MPSNTRSGRSANSLNDTGSTSFSGTKRSSSALGHSWRFKKSKAVKIQTIPKTVWLLDKPNDDVEISPDGDCEDYSITDEMVLLKGEFDLVSNQKEEDIRRELEGIFKRKYPCINMYDFDFVKRDRHTISTPVVKEAHLWDFAHVKHLCGNGRLYVRLVTSRKDIEHTEHKDSTLTASSEDVVSPANSASVTTLEVDDDEEDLPEFRANLLTTDEKVARIAAVFPGIPLNVIRGAFHAHGSIERAVNALLSYRSSEREVEPAADSLSERNIADQKTEGTEINDGESCPQVFERLRKKMLPRGMREKSKVDPDDQVMDVYSYYKSPDFDALAPISVYVKGQPAVDAGGVLRQVFGEVFALLCNNEGIKHIFTGEPYRKVPVFSNELVVNGFFEVLGKCFRTVSCKVFLGSLTYHQQFTGTWQQGTCKLP